MNINDQLKPFMEPRSVALVGVSRRTGKEAFNILENLLSCGYQGHIYPVNPGVAEIRGVETFPSIEAIQGDVDLAVIATPREAVIPLVNQCLEKGIRCITVVAQGFADADEQGKKLQRELVVVARSGGARVIGPNTFGSANAFAGFSSAFVPLEMERIPIGLICQTGVFLAGFPGLKLVGKAFDLGNACDVDFSEALEYFENDPQVSLVVAHLEGVSDGRGFLEVAGRVSGKKPVLVWKTGMTEEGARVAQSHTGSITGKNEVWKAALSRAGVVRVSELDELRDTVKAFSSLPPMKGRNIAVVSFSGGFNIMVLDACARYGLQMAPLGPSARTRLMEMAPAWLSVNNPVDIWISMTSQRGFGEMVSVLEEAFRLLLSEPQVHGLLFIGVTFEPEMPQEMARVLTNVADEFPDKPVTSFLYGQYVQGGDDAMSMSGKAANFPSVERAIRALSHLAWYYDRVHVP